MKEQKRKITMERLLFTDEERVTISKPKLAQILGRGRTHVVVMVKHASWNQSYNFFVLY
jgi:hypothetical protein